jgi:hypothetical protein
MSAIGSSADNALAESFNATFNRETLQAASTGPVSAEAFGWLHRYNIHGPFSRTPQPDRLRNSVPNNSNYADATR